MNILKLLASSSFITLNKDLAREIGLYEAIIYAELCSKALYYTERNELDNEGYFYFTSNQLENSTTLSYKKQSPALRNLKESGLISSKITGLPAKTYYKISEIEIDNLVTKFLQKGETSIDKKADK